MKMPVLSLRSAWRFRWLLSLESSQTGSYEPLTPADGLAPRAWLSATADGEPIHPTLRVTLQFVPDTPNLWAESLTVQNQRDHLVPFVGRTIYEIVEVGTLFRRETAVSVAA